MNYLTLTKSSLITSLLAISAVNGQEATPSPQEAPVEKIQEGYNVPCGINVDQSYDFFFSGSFIYWQPIQENMKLGVVSTSTATDLVDGYEADLNFKYKPGFKVGLGMNFDHNHWNTFIEYTWFRATEKVEVNLDPDDTSIGLLPAWQVPNFLSPKYSYGSETWKLKMDLLDWDLAKSYSVGKNLCFRPFFGLRSAWINQTADIDYVNTNPSYEFIWPSTYITQTTRSWGIGPRIGIGSDLTLGKGFRLYGDGEADILYTQYNLDSNQTSDTVAASGFSVTQHNANYLRTHFDLTLGLGWGTYLGSNKYHIDFSADYGFQVFLDQNMFRRTISAQALGVSTLPNGNLYISGLTISSRFDF